jgi:hypothetical protein
MRHFNLYIITLIIASCTTSDKVSNTWDFDYDYEIMKYYGDTVNSKNLRHVEYYDRGGKLIRIAGTEEGCTRFIYNNQGRLTEKVWGRNCDNGIRELMIYDSSDNLLGTYKTRDSLVNLDTVKYRQRYFYDADNNLTKELEREWNNLDGEHFEQWFFYAYENGRKTGDTIKENESITWIGSYVYDSNNNLISLNRVRNSVFKTETFKYDSAGRLVESEIKSNEHPLTPNVSFSASNNKTFYKYSADGQLIEKKILSHKGKVDSRTLYLKKRKN